MIFFHIITCYIGSQELFNLNANFVARSRFQKEAQKMGYAAPPPTTGSDSEIPIDYLFEIRI